jgi:hypothetical protein
MSVVSASQSEIASGAVLLVASTTGVAGTSHLSFAASAPPVLQITKTFASAGIPLLASFTTAGVVYPCLSTAQLAKCLILPQSAAAAGAAIPALTQCANGAPATAVAECALITVGAYKLVFLA